MSNIIDVVEFELGGELYALDIQIAREIVEMMPITPIPRAPPYISGIINLRGELTNIINLAKLLNLPEKGNGNDNIIVFMPEAIGGSNIGIIVDKVHGVIQIPENDIEQMGEALSSEASAYVKGIIKFKKNELDITTSEGARGLIIWIDMVKVLDELVTKVPQPE